MKAGLFSAVVTAFIIESYKALKQDPSEILLSRILAQLEGRANGTDIPTPSKFTPTPTEIRVNILWFLSLIFSLTTVLIGIISLQWLREYLRPYIDLEPQIAFSLHHLNVESLDRWYLPQIFTVLPLLLQLALVLFLGGILDFLWSLNSTVAIPIAVAVGLSLSFLLWTTVLPTMQALLLFFLAYLGRICHDHHVHICLPNRRRFINPCNLWLPFFYHSSVASTERLGPS